MQSPLVPQIFVDTGLFLPTKYFLAAGAGDAFERLVAFDRALLDAGIGDVNLVKLSSIVPPGCIHIQPVPLRPGALVPVAYASSVSDRAGERIASAVAIAHPVDLTRASLVMEHSGFSFAHEIEQQVIAMAREGMLSRGLEIRHIESISIEHVVRQVGATFAAVVEL